MMWWVEYLMQCSVRQEGTVEKFVWLCCGRKAWTSGRGELRVLDDADGCVNVVLVSRWMYSLAVFTWFVVVCCIRRLVDIMRKSNPWISIDSIVCMICKVFNGLCSISKHVAQLVYSWKGVIWSVRSLRFTAHVRLVWMDRALCQGGLDVQSHVSHSLPTIHARFLILHTAFTNG